MELQWLTPKEAAEWTTKVDGPAHMRDPKWWRREIRLGRVRARRGGNGPRSLIHIHLSDVEALLTARAETVEQRRLRILQEHEQKLKGPSGLVAVGSDDQIAEWAQAKLCPICSGYNFEHHPECPRGKA